MDSNNTTQPAVEQQQPSPSPMSGGSRKNKVVMWAGIAVIVVLFLGVVGYIRHSSSDSQPSSPAAQKALTAQVEITADGFVPQTLTVPAGTKVTWTNKDSSPHRVASNPYPENNGLPGLDSKDPPIGPNATYSYTFTTSGSFGYHDQYQPTTNGEIVVQ